MKAQGFVEMLIENNLVALCSASLTPICCCGWDHAAAWPPLGGSSKKHSAGTCIRGGLVCWFLKQQHTHAPVLEFVSMPAQGCECTQVQLAADHPQHQCCVRRTTEVGMSQGGLPQHKTFVVDFNRGRPHKDSGYVPRQKHTDSRTKQPPTQSRQCWCLSTKSRLAQFHLAIYIRNAHKQFWKYHMQLLSDKLKLKCPLYCCKWNPHHEMSTGPLTERKPFLCSSGWKRKTEGTFTHPTIQNRTVHKLWGVSKGNEISSMSHPFMAFWTVAVISMFQQYACWGKETRSPQPICIR